MTLYWGPCDICTNDTRVILYSFQLFSGIKSKMPKESMGICTKCDIYAHRPYRINPESGIRRLLVTNEDLSVSEE